MPKKYINALYPDQLQTVLKQLQKSQHAAISVKLAFHPTHSTHKLANEVMTANGKLADELSGQEDMLGAKSGGMMGNGFRGKDNE